MLAAGIAAAILLCGPASAQGEGAATNFVLVIDREAVLLRSQTGQARLTALADDERALAAENRSIEGELTREESDLAEKRPDMDPGAFREAADDFDRRVTAIREAQDAKERVLLDRRQRLLEAFRQEMLPVLGEIMEEREASVMLDRDAVLIFAATVDVTDEVIRRLDAANVEDGAADLKGSEDDAEGDITLDASPPPAGPATDEED